MAHIQTHKCVTFVAGAIKSWAPIL